MAQEEERRAKMKVASTAASWLRQTEVNKLTTLLSCSHTACSCPTIPLDSPRNDSCLTVLYCINRLASLWSTSL